MTVIPEQPVRRWRLDGETCTRPPDSRRKGAGEAVRAQLLPERRSSRTSTPRVKESGKPRARKEEAEVIERPFAPLTDQRQGSEVKPYSSSIKVNGGPTYSSWKQTSAPSFRPMKRFIPEYNPKGLEWRPSRRHPCSRQCYHQQPEFAFIYQPGLIVAGKENSVLPFRPCKRYIPEYYPKGKEWRPSRMHLCSNQCAHKQQNEKVDSEPHRSSVKLVKGPYHYDHCSTVQHGDATFRPLEHEQACLPSSRSLVSKPMAPQGRLNEYIIDGHFHRPKQSVISRPLFVDFLNRLQSRPTYVASFKKELLTEQKAQFVNCKPWIRQGIFEEVTQASKENGFRACSVDLSMTRHLYEDRTSLVNIRPCTAAGRILNCNGQSHQPSQMPLYKLRRYLNK